MQITDLPSPDIGVRGIKLRSDVANAISKIQVVAPAYTTGKPASATTLRAFFIAAETALRDFDSTYVP